MTHNLLNPDDIHATACAAINTAREYFNLDPLWQITLTLAPLKDDESACVHITADHLRADITLNPTAHDSLARVWQDCGHEVAHIVLADLEPLRAHLEQDGDKWDAVNRIFRRGIELAVTRLELAFARDRPFQPQQDVTLTGGGPPVARAGDQIVLEADRGVMGRGTPP